MLQFKYGGGRGLGGHADMSMTAASVEKSNKLKCKTAEHTQIYVHSSNYPIQQLNCADKGQKLY